MGVVTCKEMKDRWIRRQRKKKKAAAKKAVCDVLRIVLLIQCVLPALIRLPLVSLVWCGQEEERKKLAAERARQKELRSYSSLMNEVLRRNAVCYYMTELWFNPYFCLFVLVFCFVFFVFLFFLLQDAMTSNADMADLDVDDYEDDFM